LPNADTSAFVHSLESTISVPLNAEHLQQLKHASRDDDPVSKRLRETILHGWPDSKAELPEHSIPHYDFRDELVSQGELTFKGDQIVIPAAM